MDTTKIADNIDGLADREFKTGGMKLSFGSIMAIFAFLSTVEGGLYGGVGMCEKLGEVVGLDLGENARIVIPLNKPNARINGYDLYQIELTQRRLEIQKLRDELEALKNLQNSSGEMEFEN